MVTNHGGEGGDDVSDGAFNIYIVDDDRDVRASLSFMLATAGRTCRTFSGAQEYLDALDTLEPGCALIDIRMPVMDGMQLLTELARRECKWPVVMMTGHGEISLAAQAMRLGAIDFLEKPFEEELLLACLDKAADLLKDRGGA